MLALLAFCGSVPLGFWSNTAETPIISIPISPSGGTFAEWNAGSAGGAGGTAESAGCSWWNGTFYYDPGVCNAFSITRISTSDMEEAINRAQHCALLVNGESQCVLNGEIGFSVPSLFLYDHDEHRMRMLIAPRFLVSDSGKAGQVKTVRMQDPRGGARSGASGEATMDERDPHPNQLFKFNTTVTVEYLKGGSRTMATEELEGDAAYCVQALRRSIAPACWEALD